MAFTDIVIDTNILMHANNNIESTQGDCIELINYLLASTESICVDTAIDINKSRILHEYLDNLKTPGTIGRSFVEKMLQWKRFIPVSKKTPQSITKIVDQHIQGNKHEDKIFVKIAFNSTNKTFVSHDFEDFRVEKRQLFLDRLGVNVATAQEVNGL